MTKVWSDQVFAWTYSIVGDLVHDFVCLFVEMSLFRLLFLVMQINLFIQV